MNTEAEYMGLCAATQEAIQGTLGLGIGKMRRSPTRAEHQVEPVQ
jgi:hypothetical protein